MDPIQELLARIDGIVWGPVMLGFILGTGLYLNIRLHWLPIRRLPYALGCVFGRDNRRKTASAKGSVSAFSALTTELAATIGTGNIVGVATAMVLGGPGAIIWMMLSSLLGMGTKLAESMLAVKYREKNRDGELVGGPMYTLQNAFGKSPVGHGLAMFFALCAVFASFGMGNMTQANSIADAMSVVCNMPKILTGLVSCILAILVVLGGIRSIAGLTSIMVPFMGILYLLGAFWVIGYHIKNIPMGIYQMFRCAFTPSACAGGLFGNMTVCAGNALRWGVARGTFSNEAGLGAAGISAASADTEDPVNQGYISMTGVFLDTIVICFITALALAASGVVGSLDASGKPVTGTLLTVKAFSSALGEKGTAFVGISIALFAFATIVAWAYQGEKAFEFLVGHTKYNLVYRMVYGLIVLVGAVCSLDVVWSFSDICNGLMAIPNLICLLALSDEVVKDLLAYDKRYFS